MTVATTSLIAGPFAGTGAAAVLPFSFKCYDVRDLMVVRDGTPLGYGSDYGVVLNSDQSASPGGIVTMNSLANLTGSSIIITLNMAESQPTSLPSQSIWSPTTVEGALDRLTLLIKQLHVTVTRAAMVPIGEVIASLPNRANRANKFFSFDSNGDPTVVSGTGSKGDPGGNAAAIGLFTSASALSIPGGTDAVRTSGYSTVGTGVADYFYDVAVDATYVANNPRTSFLTANGRGFRLAKQTVDATRFGAKGDYNGTTGTDNQAMLAAALAYIAAIGGGVLFLAAGLYFHSAYLPVSPKTVIRGEGMGASQLISTHTGGGGANNSENVRNGSSLYSSATLNASNFGLITIEDVWIKNTNAGNVGAGYYDLGNSYITVNRARVTGFKYGVVFNQTEVAAITFSVIEAQLTTGIGIWFVNGASLSPGGLGGFTNRLTVGGCQINQGTTTYCIVDDGGTDHLFQGNNYNGGINAIRFGGSALATVIGGEFESQSSHCIDSQLTSLDGTLSGGNWITIITGGYSAAGGKSSINCGASSGSLSVFGLTTFAGGGGTAYAIAGITNLASFTNAGAINNTPMPAVYDQTVRASQHFDTTLRDIVATQPYFTSTGKKVAISYEAGDFGQIQAIDPGVDWKELKLNGKPLTLQYGNISVAGTTSLGFEVRNGYAYYLNGLKVVGARSTGWTAATGGLSRSAFVAAAAGTASATYVQSELQGALTRLAAAEARIVAYDAMLITHGLIGP